VVGNVVGGTHRNVAILWGGQDAHLRRRQARRDCRAWPASRLTTSSLQAHYRPESYYRPEPYYKLTPYYRPTTVQAAAPMPALLVVVTSSHSWPPAAGEAPGGSQGRGEGWLSMSRTSASVRVCECASVRVCEGARARGCEGARARGVRHRRYCTHSDRARPHTPRTPPSSNGRHRTCMCSVVGLGLGSGTPARCPP